MNTLRETLEACRDYFDDRADIEYSTTGPEPIGNEEASLLAMGEKALRELGESG